jgi:hypothetical protein
MRAGCPLISQSYFAQPPLTTQAYIDVNDDMKRRAVELI